MIPDKNAPDCTKFTPLVNGGDYRGTICCYCGEKEADHNAPKEWAELWQSMRVEPFAWVETTRNMFDEMLGAVPPRAMGAGCFLVGEADHHNAQGEAVYACFKGVHGSQTIKAMYMTHAQFQQLKAARI